MKRLLLPLLLVAALHAAPGQDRPQPVKALLVVGGGFHDYDKQKDILEKGIEERANISVDVVFTKEYPMGANNKPDITKPQFPIYGNPDYAKGYDIVIHDECSAGISDPAVIQGVLKPHKDGIPGVNLHCAMHSYRFGNIGKPVTPGGDNAHWFEYLGVQSTSHGPQTPIDIAYIDPAHPATKGLSDWRTINEELYNNIQILPTATPLAKGKQVVRNKDGTDKTVETVVTWANQYGKTRVWSTTIGHNNDTVADARYLDLVTRGVLWACDKLDANGQPKTGYGPAK